MQGKGEVDTFFLQRRLVAGPARMPASQSQPPASSPSGVRDMVSGALSLLRSKSATATLGPGVRRVGSGTKRREDSAAGETKEEIKRGSAADGSSS